jgi:hypothetical protein
MGITTTGTTINQNDELRGIRYAGLGAVQTLYLALLIHRQHSGVGEWV